MISDLFDNFFEDLAKDAIKLVNKWLVDLMDIALNCQAYMTNNMKVKGIDFDAINSVMLKYALALIVLKFLQKGFCIYILQSDGDPDHDPLALLTGMFQAVAISVTFFSLYTPLVNIFKKFTSEILKAMSSKGEIQEIKEKLIDTLLGQGLTTLLLVIVFLVVVMILYVKIIMNGAELMVLRFAIPILSVGLMDADGGAFKVAGKKFLQMGFTCSLQIILLRFAMALLLTKHPIWAIAFGTLSLGVPRLIQDYLFIRQGGGASSKLQAVANLRRLFK